MAVENYAPPEIGLNTKMFETTTLITQKSAPEVVFLRLFQHTFGAHPEQPLPTGYIGIPFIVGHGGLPGVCSRGML